MKVKYVILAYDYIPPTTGPFYKVHKCAHNIVVAMFWFIILSNKYDCVDIRKRR